jgi:ribonuclease-3
MTAAALERDIGYSFRDKALLNTALRHRSFGTPHNERLEFLGDGVLNCAIAALLFQRCPDLDEGVLSRLRANLVRQDTLHDIALTLDLGAKLALGEGEMKSGGHRRPSILADAVEALFGAVYLDGGFEAAFAVIARQFEPRLAGIDLKQDIKDAKTRLQEWLQGRRLPVPYYQVRDTRGAAHAQQFVVCCEVPSLDIATEGLGPSRRAAEQDAAQAALKLIEGQRHE